MENLIFYFIENFLIVLIFVPMVLVYKAFLFVHITNEAQVTIQNFFFFGHPNVATTHDSELRKKKLFQNSLTWVLVSLVVLQVVLAIPIIVNS